jgi:hypothetical protein
MLASAFLWAEPTLTAIPHIQVACLPMKTAELSKKQAPEGHFRRL